MPPSQNPYPYPPQQQAQNPYNQGNQPQGYYPNQNAPFNPMMNPPAIVMLNNQRAVVPQ